MHILNTAYVIQFSKMPILNQSYKHLIQKYKVMLIICIQQYSHTYYTKDTEVKKDNLFQYPKININDSTG